MCMCKRGGGTDDDNNPIHLIGGAIIIWIFASMIYHYVK